MTEAFSPPKHRSTRHQAVALTRLMGLSLDENGVQGTLLQRAEQRVKRLHEQYQLNVEAVLHHAVEHSDNDVAGHEPDPDWLHQFLSLAEKVHSPRMQELWGKILATELSQPGSFSLRALDTLRQMTQKDALLLGRAVALSSMLNSEPNRKILLGYRRMSGYGGLLPAGQPSLSLSQFGLPYSAILTLREQGILFAAELETGLLTQGEPLRLRLLNQTLLLRPRHNRLRLRYYRFTPLGLELARLVLDQGDADYIAALSKMLSRDFELTSG
ncbi:TIGR03899 family protein [Ferrimonas balearica]|uniref:TIGR03899 family protein n=1 Tax=Ferrimonas balearica TaxID=44012 RepID=UPI001C58AB70|nr:TIGR03899 family protein [Ferrimonas balearica]MBW3165433.1 TIGR03899 family protein [Ferrimonas balearica]MBY6226271.1 TIGR03899 family protein [Ferrimonas balearica]